MDEGNEEEDDSLEADAMIKVTTMFNSFLRQNVAHRNVVDPDPKIQLGKGFQFWVLEEWISFLDPIPKVILAILDTNGKNENFIFYPR